jgi:hypothetical protein
MATQSTRRRASLSLIVMRKFSASAIILLCSFALLFSGCFDRTKRIATHTLIGDDGRLDVAAFTAAITSRFAAGSSVAKLTRYVKSTGGTCGQSEPDKLRCEIPVRGTVCVANLIGINALTNGDSIVELAIHSGDLTC